MYLTRMHDLPTSWPAPRGITSTLLGSLSLVAPMLCFFSIATKTLFSSKSTLPSIAESWNSSSWCLNYHVMQCYIEITYCDVKLCWTKQTQAKIKLLLTWYGKDWNLVAGAKIKIGRTSAAAEVHTSALVLLRVSEEIVSPKNPGLREHLRDIDLN